MTDFNLQTFLQDMDARHMRAIESLGEEMKAQSIALADHSTRLTVLENTRKNLKWLFTITVGALVSSVTDFWLRHHGA